MPPRQGEIFFLFSVPGSAWDRTYKNEEVNTHLPRGRPNSVLILQGIRSHSQDAVSCRVTLRNFCFATLKGSANPIRRLSSHGLWRLGELGLPRLEKRSQALQGCNLTRNIQVDGAPRVHLPGRFRSARFFLSHHRTPEPCLENPPSQRPRSSAGSP